ncbi:MAG TPA: OmpW family outer membrane protein [Thermoanaerobaculia bacterium]|jgi:outer membrane protein W|nr:OmpW family outer membrane protein [Thermoanaerobaculia bacterium]
MPRFRLAACVLASLLGATGRGEAALLPSEVAIFPTGVAPASAETVVAPGRKLSLRPGPGLGLGVVFREPSHLATLVTLGVARLPLRLAGAGGSTSGGGIDFVPLSVVEQLRFPRGRLQPYVGAGITLPFTPRTELSGAVRQAGIAAIRRPDHPALVVNAGAEVALSERAALVVDLHWVPFAETLVVVPRGEVFKSQELMLDLNPLTVSVGVAWRPFRR